MPDILDKPGTATQQLILQGPADSPLLAPRGVWIVGSRLFVSDTAQNRVFVWNRLPAGPHQAPDVVLGQAGVADSGRNAGTAVSAATLLYPSGIWSDGTRLVVADAWNHRVLIWHKLPVRHGQPADVVIGQPDFASNGPNVGGMHARPSARSLYWCYGVFSDGERLWIADTGNRRVLFYETIPTENYAAASRVIGQADFTGKDYDPANAIWPYSVKVSPAGALAVTDTQYYRVLLWHDWRQAFQAPADVLIGQPDFGANGQNQFGFGPGPHTLSWCYDACFHKKGLWVADTGNSRLLWFNPVPTGHNAAADDVLGKDDFRTGSENPDTIAGTDKTLYWPFSLAISGGVLAVADTGNHRIILYKLAH